MVVLHLPDAEGRDGSPKILCLQPPQPSICDQYLQDKNNKVSDDEKYLLHDKKVSI